MSFAMRIGSVVLLLCIGHAPLFAQDDRPLERAARVRDILRVNCYHCHGQDGTNEGGFNYVLDRAQLVSRKKVTPGDLSRSRLWKRLTSADNPMPPEDQKQRPSADEVALVKRWIETGAADVAAPAAERPFIGPSEMEKQISTDLEKVPERERRFKRYFTLVHLYNAGLSVDEMQSYRHGLSKLVNSLSWGSRIVVPHAINDSATVLRIDLRDYQWNEKTWETILAANPYGFATHSNASQYTAQQTQCSLPWVRADWFVSAASRPPLYHDVLQLPATDAELERLLRVDVAEDIRLERVVRAAFNSSGVSRNNRLVERHESGSVVYWKSYDFRTNTGRQNLFTHPIGPGERETDFLQDGGEIIFNLPNGLQAYMLVDQQGRRIDKGPTAIVSDPKRPDRAVENGLSCMSCHAKGMIDKADQVREHVLKNPEAFAQGELETIKALYPPREQFASLVQKDARRFQDAVLKTGAPLSVTEPIVALALRFEAEMDLALCAAEAGVTPDTFLKGLARSPALAKQLGPLKIEGGTVQRQVFVDAFGDLIGELRLGEFLEPRNAALGRLLREAGRAVEKKDLLAALRLYSEAIGLEPDNALAYLARGDVYREKDDRDLALADYNQAIHLVPHFAVALNNRGLVHKSRGDLERALADFSEAVRSDPRLSAAWLNRGATLQARGDLDRAIEDYSEAIRLNAKSVLALNNRGYAHFEKEAYDLARADFDQALKLDPRFVAALNNRGLVHSRKGDLDKAIADFSAAIRLDAKFARAYFNRAVAFEKQGDQARAAADRAEATHLDPSLGKE